MKKLAFLTTVLALAAFGFTACGGDDDGGGTTAATTTDETTTEAAGPDEGATLEVSADPSGQLAYEQTHLAAKPGAVTVNFTNDASIGHDFVIEDAGGEEVARTDVITSDSTTLETQLNGGQYTFYCSVDSHREAGMQGPLIIG